MDIKTGFKNLILYFVRQVFDQTKATTFLPE